MKPRCERRGKPALGLVIAGGLFVLAVAMLGVARPAKGAVPDHVHVRADGDADVSGSGGSLPPDSDQAGEVVPALAPVPPFPQLDRVIDFEQRVERRPGRQPIEVHGLYLTGYTAGRTGTIDRLLRELHGTSFNALVIDVKNDAGRISYRSDVPLAREIGADVDWIADPEGLLAKLRAEGIYSIARIVVFKDPILARKRPDLAIHDLSGNPWHDQTGAAWLDPSNREAWAYPVALAQEAAGKGFQEIQFDYVRFPSDGETKEIASSGATGGKAEMIAEFLRYAREKLEPYDVYLSADIFGLVGTVTDDMGIGQNLEKLLGAVDYLCPMVYPSHYREGNYGIEDPEAQPYATVRASLQAYQRRMATADSATGLRPWLQDFSLRVHYGAAEVAAQIKAATDLGIKEFILWNPANVYDTDVFGREETGRPGAE